MPSRSPFFLGCGASPPLWYLISVVELSNKAVVTPHFIDLLTYIPASFGEAGNPGMDRIATVGL